MLTAVFVVGRLGEIEGDYRYVYVEKLPEGEVMGQEIEENFDRIKLQMWAGDIGILARLKEGIMITAKGRLQVNKQNELFVVVELLRTY